MSTRTPENTVINWEVPDTHLDALYGDGATGPEKALPTLTGLAGVIGVATYAWMADLPWAWWHYLIAVVLAFDLIGGVVAMGLNSAKRFHHAVSIPVPRFGAALTRNEVLFTAIHLQPIVIAWLFPGTTIWWGFLWYAIALAGVLIIQRIPLYLARPAALMAVALAPVVAMMLPHPLGFAWLPAVLITKLVLGSVREEPYRPKSPIAP